MSDMATQMNWADLIEEAAKGGAGEPLPIGDYDVQVVEAEAKMSGTGKLMFKTKNRVIAGPYVGRHVWNNYVVSPESPNALGFFFQHMAVMGLDRAYFAQQPPPAVVAQQLLGRTARFGIQHRMYNNAMTMDVKSVTTCLTQASAIPAQAAPGVPVMPRAGVPAPQPAMAPPQMPVAAPAPQPAPVPQPVAPMPAPVPQPVAAPAPIPQPTPMPVPQPVYDPATANVPQSAQPMYDPNAVAAPVPVPMPAPMPMPQPAPVAAPVGVPAPAPGVPPF